MSEPYSALAETMRQAVGNIRRALQSNLDKRALKLSLPEARILDLMNNQPGITSLEIGQLSGYDKAVVARKIKCLQQAGLLARKQDEQDQRRINLHLTQTGVQRCRQVSEAQKEAHAQVFHALSLQEQEQVARLLSRCL